jgi:hypothetical protein
VQNGDQQQPDRLAQIERVAQLLVVENLQRPAQVGLEIGRSAPPITGQQRPGVHQHQRIVVDIDDTGGRVGRWAISWVLGEVGMPVPMSRNCRTPCPAMNRTARCRNQRFSHTLSFAVGCRATISSAAARSAEAAST